MAVLDFDLNYLHMVKFDYMFSHLETTTMVISSDINFSVMAISDSYSVIILSFVASFGHS